MELTTFVRNYIIEKQSDTTKVGPRVCAVWAVLVLWQLLAAAAVAAVVVGTPASSSENSATASPSAGSWRPAAPNQFPGRR